MGFFLWIGECFCTSKIYFCSTMAQQNSWQSLVAHCKEYGFIFQSSEIYDGLQAVYDYGPWGVELKKNIREYWWKTMVYQNQNIVGIDASIFMHPTTWKASGHVDSFSDPLIDNLDSNKRYRVDHLIEGHADSLREAGESDKAQALLDEMEKLEKEENLAGLKNLIISNDIKCAVSETCNWTDVRQFNLMFGTQVGSVAEDSTEIYLRPETAQGIFVNFLNVQKTSRQKIPFGIAQTGKAFRNEIVARQFIFRMREFEQMEMQFFVRPGTQKEWYEHWKEKRNQWHQDLGIPAEKSRFHDHVKLAHYADAACDIEYEFPFGFKEVEGIHSRTDFDLKQHQEFSKKKQQYFDNDIDPETNKPYGNYVPYVIETSIGLDRTVLMVLSEAFKEEDLSTEEKKDSRKVLSIPPKLAPIKLAILPLIKKKGLPEKAKELLAECQEEFNCFYEEKNAIGKRYRIQDALGTPFCVTIDFDTLEDNTVTIRHRDSMEQERIPMSAVKDLVKNSLK